MNSVSLMGRLTRDPEVRQSQSGTVTAFTLAIDRPTKDKQTDYPRVVTFGRQAESCAKYLKKGSQVGVTGSLQTGSYEKDGERRYTTDVIANRVEFLSKAENPQNNQPVPEGFAQLDEDVPF